MALKLPGANDLNAPVSGRSGRPIASYDASAIGKGIAQAGQGMQALAAGLKMHDAQEKKKVDQASAFETQSRYLQFEEQQRKAFADAILNAPVGADGFSAQQADTYRKSAREFMKSVPDDLKPEYDQTLFKLETAITSKADAFAVQERDRVAQTKIADGQNVILQGLQDNPAGWRDADAQAEALVRNSGRTAIDQDMDLREWRKRRAEALWEVDSRTNGPEARERLGIAPADGGSGVDQFVNRIIRVESGGRADAKNPNSSATGPGQFIASTWLGMVKKYRPDLMAGRSAGEVLALRTDPSLSREMTRLYAQENANFLAAQGLAQTPGNIYLAHFLGPRGAAQVLKAAPGAPIESIVGADAVKANGFLSGKSASWVASWAEKKMGGAGGSVVAPEYADLPYEDRVKLYDTSLAQEKREQEAAAVQLRAQQAAFKDALALGIETGSVVSRQEILGANIGDGDKVTLLKALETKLKQDAGVSELTANILAGSPAASVNPFDDEQRKIADKTYDAMERAVPNEQKGVVTDAFVNATGYIPQRVQAVVRQGALSTDPGILAGAMSQADALQTAAPISFEAFAGGSDVRNRLADFRHFVNDLGMSGEEAAREMLRRADPAAKANREVLKTEAAKFVKGLSVAQVTDAFDTFWGPGGEPGAGIMPEQSSVLLAEYREIAENAYYATGGDEGLAKARALAEIKTRWNVSSISGSPHLMRLPPELHYPPVGGSHEYLRADAMETAKAYAADFGRKVDNVAIWSDARTRADIEMGRPARYRLFYQYTEDGQTKFDEVLSGRWGVDAEVVQKASDENRARFLAAQERDAAANEIEREAAERAREIATDPTREGWIKALDVEGEIVRGRTKAHALRAQEDAEEAEPDRPRFEDDPEAREQARRLSERTQGGRF